MIEVRINGKNLTLDLSDEVRDLIDDAVIAAINENVIAETGTMDFDVRRLKGAEFSGELNINFTIKVGSKPPSLFNN